MAFRLWYGELKHVVATFVAHIIIIITYITYINIEWGSIHILTHSHSWCEESLDDQDGVSLSLFWGSPI